MQYFFLKKINYQINQIKLLKNFNSDEFYANPNQYHTSQGGMAWIKIYVQFQIIYGAFGSNDLDLSDGW